MRYIRLVVQYDGTDYAGFQTQPDLPTIQYELERVCRRVLGHEVRLTSASRTDAGVHALGQVVRLRTQSPIPVPGLVKALNGKLPQAISVVGGEEADEGFHPRYHAVAKLYSYRILNRELPSPFIERYAWRIEQPLDVEQMARGAQHLLGRHDFSAFEATGSSIQGKVRCIGRLSCDRHGELVEIRILGDGFLYMMVRNIVGTLIEVGSRRMSPEQVGIILQSRDRTIAGPTAVARGLCLVRVDY